MKTLAPMASPETAKLMSPHASVEMITPAQATFWLDNHNDGNYRKIVLPQVARLKDDIVNKRWTLTTSAIGFDTDGELVNGQHRLTAIKEAGLACVCIIVRDMPIGSRDNPSEDTGRRRTVTTHLTNSGHKNTAMLASIARGLYKLKHTGDMSSSMHGQITDSKLVNMVENNPSLQTATDAAAHSKRCVGTTPSIFGIWYWLVMFDDKELADDCVAVYSDRKEVSTSHPFIRLRELLRKHRDDSKSRNRLMKEELQLRYFMAAWAKVKAGHNVKRLKPVTDITISDNTDVQLQLIDKDA